MLTVLGKWCLVLPPGRPLVSHLAALTLPSPSQTLLLSFQHNLPQILPISQLKSPPAWETPASSEPSNSAWLLRAE